MIKKCFVCYKEFVDKKHPHKFLCSRKCAGIYKRKRVIRFCKKCNKSFECLGSASKRYCSIGCFNRRSATRKADMIRICQKCKKRYKRNAGNLKQRYCSLECSGRAKIIHKDRKCLFCTKLYKPRSKESKYCSASCGRKHYNHKVNKDKITKSNKHLYKFCMRCKYSEVPQILERHHIDRNPKNNHKSNILILCPNCHTLDHFLNKDGQFANNYGRT